MELNFVHLRLHTEYSLSDGLLQIPALIERALQFGMPAIAITDLSNLYGTVKFYQEAFKKGIKPIIGIDLWLAADRNSTKSTRLTLLCQTHLGYKNLLKLVSRAYLEGGNSDQPTIQKSWLDGSAEGLIALSGALESDIAETLLIDDPEKAKLLLTDWMKIFPNRFYIELSRIGNINEQKYIESALKLAEEFKVPVVATNNVRFLDRDDFEAHEARVCIHEGVTLNDPNRSRRYTDQQYFRSQQEMLRLFADIPEALKNTVEIAKRCNVIFTLGKSQLPHFTVPETNTAETYLSKIAKQGLIERLEALFDTQSESFAAKQQSYEKRLNQELSVINKMGFAGYFLIVADFTKWAKENGIPVGPGRGSGPGSLVAFALKITDLDPIALELLFERFLNPERVTMPDFDIDFCVEGRDRVIEYVIHKHGSESVSQIITYGTMTAKAVVRDVGRVLALGYGFVDKIAKLIPFELGMTLDKALEQEVLLQERYEQEEEVRTLVDLAKKLEGITRNVGKHAGGIVIAPGKLTDFVPLYCEPGDALHPLTQFDKDDVEAVGLVKFDFLGLKTLTIINRALLVINQTRKDKNEKPIDISLIALDDLTTFNLLKACQSTAIFQLESHGMRDLIKRMQPDCFEDLIALVALFRPGPLQSGMVDDFINRKQGRAKVLFPHPKLEPILKPTYGVILYQEQVMQIAQVLAGYTLGAADILRRAMGKKMPEEMAKQREIFCKGAMQNGVQHELANHIFDLMEKFAGYGFNKSHSASYALIAYQTAWLKAHYKAAYMAAVLSADLDRTEKIIGLLDECRALHIHVTPPDINKSEYYFKVLDDQHLMYGLGAIKGVGQAAIENIITVRNAQGDFKDIFDFCRRIDIRKTNKRVFEALIKSGCFDCLNRNRAQLLASLSHALLYAEQALHNQTYGQQDLLSTQHSTNTPEYVDCSPWNEETQLQGEKATLGFYLTGHPLNRFLKELTHLTTCRISELTHDLKTARVAGIITQIRMRQTKRGDRMAIFVLDDGAQQIEVVCFSDCYQKYRSMINEDQIIVIEGEVSVDDFNKNIRIVSRDLYTLEQARERHAKALQIRFRAEKLLDMQNFSSLLLQYTGGNCPVIIRYLYNDIEATIRLGTKWLIKPTDALIKALKDQLMTEEIEFLY